MFETFGAQVGFMISVTLGVVGGFAFLEWLADQDES
jgi:hypothetical protein